ncbi:MAG: hypothetical protein AAF665_17695 [Pseudomonadota bacterium]
MRFTTKIAACFSVVLGVSAAQAGSDILPKDNAEFTKWGEESGWNIFVDQSRETCLIERVDEQQNVVQMGLTPDKEFGYLGVFTKNDVEFENDKVHLLLDEEAYVGDAVAAPANLAEGYKGGYILANNPDFVDDVMKRYNMIVMPETSFAFEVSLDGTMKAIEKARECNTEVEAS